MLASASKNGFVDFINITNGVRRGKW